MDANTRLYIATCAILASLTVSSTSVLSDDCSNLAQSYAAANKRFKAMADRLSSQGCSANLDEIHSASIGLLEEKISLRSRLENCSNYEGGNSTAEMRAALPKLKQMFAQGKKECQAAVQRGSAAKQGKEGPAACPSNLAGCVTVTDRGKSIKQHIFELHQTCKGVKISFQYTTCGTKKCETVPKAMNGGATDMEYGFSLPTALNNFSCVSMKK